MATRLDSVERLLRLQGQRVAQIEIEIASLRVQISKLLAEKQNLLDQIEKSLGANQAIIDLLFRRLDALSRREADLNGALVQLQGKLIEQKLREKAVERGVDATRAQVDTDLQRRTLGELLDIVVARAGTSFR